MHAVLVIEDDPSIGALMLEVLGEAGYCVTVIRTAQDAVRTVEAGGVDLIIADLNRGAYSDGLWNGIDQLRRVSQTTPIIVCTGHSEARKVSLVQHNVSTIIMKPFDIDDLLIQVSDLMAASHAFLTLA